LSTSPGTTRSQPHLSDLWSHGKESSINNLGTVNADTVRGYLLTVVNGAPVLEEVFYRGCLQAWLARRLPAPASVVAATAVFTAAHGMGSGAYNSVQLVSVAITGLTFGVLYHRSGSLIPDIAAHMALNGTTLAHTWGGVSDLRYATALAIIAGIGLIVMGPRLQVHRSRGPAEENPGTARST
jgi:membrane protease YdiL (CAAX protease family)